MDVNKIRACADAVEKVSERFDAFSKRRDGEKDDLAAQRKKEYEEERSKAKTALEKYWAGSATASLARDVKAGRGKAVGGK